jgi:NAD(P)-dependent dehydrogenase (short-subunit alcohol dehydrogenase family)
VNVVVFGATRGMGRAVARELAARGDSVFLLGRDEADLRRSTADLHVRAAQTRSPGSLDHRSPGSLDPGVLWARCDLLDPSTFAPALAAAQRALGGIDTVVVTAGEFGTQAQLEADRDLTQRVLLANFTNTVLFCEDARRLLLPRGGTLCVFSSVAGERGRKPVILYGATKAGLTRYLEGLDHKFRAAGLKVVTVKPGFVKTGMTAALKPPPFAGTPEAVARRVVRAIDRGTPVVYAPDMWRWIMLVIRNLPRFVMRRLGF